MGQYTYVVQYFYVASLDGINEVILSPEEEGLTSAEQIFNISWDANVMAYLVCYRVRKWLNGGEGA